jgi:3-deoxy-D-manno-octulosonate 8-phosphate phosphatase (KDO 8-P phosphatase)
VARRPKLQRSGLPRAAEARARRVRVLMLDVDGVMTDGKVCLLSFPGGSVQEMKQFDAHDGAGLKLAHDAGLRTGVITGRQSAAVTRRAAESGMEFVYQGRADKIVAYEEFLRAAQVEESAVAYVGDDLPDVPLLRRVGFAVAVANAAPEVKRVAHFVTKRAGGYGAVREVIEHILKAQGKWDAVAGHARA